MLFLCTGCQYISSFFEDGDVKPGIKKESVDHVGFHLPAPNVTPDLLMA